MGLFDEIKKKLSHEFIDIVEWLDDSQDTIVHRFERYQNEIKNGARLIVRCLLYTSPSPRDVEESRMPSSA